MKFTTTSKDGKKSFFSNAIFAIDNAQITGDRLDIKKPTTKTKDNE